MKTYGRACHTALAYGMNDEFSRVLNQQMDYFSNDPSADRMNRIKGEMSQVIIYHICMQMQHVFRAKNLT